MFHDKWNKHHPPGTSGNVGPSSSAVRQFLTYNYSKLQREFTLLDLSGGGHAAALPDAEAKQCASILAAGHLQQQYVLWEDRSILYIEHVYFTSIRDAVRNSPFLQQVCEDHNISLDHLLRRCKEADPDSVYRHLPMKRALAAATTQLRAAFGGQQLSWLGRLPTLLHDTFYMDECTVWVGKDMMGKLMVWCHKDWLLWYFLL
uniref:Uncharacterized protein n=1 Tax=Tetradesmus obliquus TaxID=3088 RepID=A0A383W1V5_TETOB|eukprot:jgi/Sobl393_1/716/SZX71471.1